MRFLLYNYHFLALTIAQVFCENGKTPLRENSLIGPGFPDELGRFPWHVGIYYMNWTSGDLDHICGGSLIAPDLVISAAHCFYDEDEGRMNDPLDYAVAAGKIRRSYYELEDVEQKSQVRWIDVPDGFIGLRGNSTSDIAVVRLRRSLTGTQFVGPVSIDWNRKYTGDHLRNGTIGKVTGCGLTAEGIPSEELRMIDLPYIDRDYCRRGAPEDFSPLVTNDKICAGCSNGSIFCKGDTGGGYCFWSDGQWYLRGVVSVNALPGNGTSDTNYYSALTNVEHYLDWIGEFLDDAQEWNQTMESSTTGSCSLPEQPEGGRFEQHLSGKSSDHAAGSRVPIDSVLIYRCDEGYTIRGNDFSLCKDEGWTPPPTCVKPCPALRLTDGDILCKYNGEIVPCGSAMAPGTRATPKCKNYYEPSPASKEIECLEGGVWTSPEFQCVPECGKAANMETPLIVNGSSVMHGSFPWHVGVYHESVEYFLTAGTLIKPDLIFAPIWYFHDDNVNAFIVIAGKYYTSYKKVEPYTQTSLVKKIYKQSDYSDDEESTPNHIALLRLETPFAMTKLVRPVCLDWRSQIAEGFPEVVKMAQWSSGARTRLSHDTYFEIEVRFVNRTSCSSWADPSDRRYWTSDKFCSQLTVNANLGNFCCHRIGGIYAEKNKKWYLAGSPRVYDSYFLIWTNVDTLPSLILEAERDKNVTVVTINSLSLE